MESKLDAELNTIKTDMRGIDNKLDNIINMLNK